MSLAINVDKILKVLIAGEWYGVEGGSFTLDSYEYLWHPKGEGAVNSHGGDIDPVIMQGGGQHGVCANGFSFSLPVGSWINDEPVYQWMAGPLTAIQAIRYKP